MALSSIENCPNQLHSFLPPQLLMVLLSLACFCLRTGLLFVFAPTGAARCLLPIAPSVAAAAARFFPPSFKAGCSDVSCACCRILELCSTVGPETRILKSSKSSRLELVFQIGLAVQPPEDAGKPFNQTSVVIALCLLALSVHYVYLLGNCQKKPHKSEKMKSF